MAEANEEAGAKRASSRRTSEAPPPAPGLVPDDVAGYILALIVGAAGALVFVAVDMPLPWFLGSLTAGLVASVLRVPIVRPRPLAIPMRAVLGVAVGSAFTPAVLDRLGAMAGSLLLLIPFMLLIIFVGMAFYGRLAGFDRPTAFFSAVPGGLTDMTAMAEEAGANQRAVILTQATRIVVVVFALPLWLKWHDGLEIGAVMASRVHLAEAGLADLLVLVAMGWGGWLAASWLGLAGAPIVGPMLVSGLAHAFGLTSVHVPAEVLTVAQICVGILLGCQFRGLTWREFETTMLWGIAFSLLLLVVTGVVVAGVSHVTGFDAVSVLLAFAPAGQTEMNLLTYILGLDVAYVALHHLARLAIVIFGAQIVFAARPDWRRAAAASRTR
jgi:membrane AbrB-like protein